jgi:hypothetical protein
VRQEALGQLKKPNDLIGTRSLDLPACSIVPLPRVPDVLKVMKLIVSILTEVAARLPASAREPSSQLLPPENPVLNGCIP